MFILKNRASYFWLVKFRFAGAHGAYESHEFSAEFKRIPQQRIDEIVEGLRTGDPKLTDEGIAREVMIGWKDIADENGNLLPFNEDTLTSLLSIPGARTGLIKAFFDSVSGVSEKN